MALTPHIKDFPTLIRELNRELEGMQQALKLTPRLNSKGDLDMQGRRITRVGRTAHREDVPNVRELQDKALYEDPSGKHRANSSIAAPHGIRSKRKAQEPDELVPLSQVQQLVATGGSGSSDAVLTTNVDQNVSGQKFFKGLSLLAKPVACVNGDNSLNLNSGSGAEGAFIRLSGPTAAFAITQMQNNSGSQGGRLEQLIILYNSTNFPMTIKHDTGLVVENRFKLPNDASIVIRKHGSIAVLYSSIDFRWVALSFA